MRRKRAKLQVQNASMDTEASGEEKSNIFKGVSVYVNGWTKPSVQDIRRLLVQHSGVFQPYLDKKSIVTHVVTCSLTAAKVKEFKHMKVVRPEWLLDSVAAGSLLPWTNYIFRPGDRSEQSQGSQIGQATLQLQAAQPTSVTPTPKAGQSNSSGAGAEGVAGPSKEVRLEPESSGSEWTPRPLYATDPATEEDTARVPKYAVHRNEMAERVMADPQWRAAHTSIAPDFIEGFYKNSRLHHLSTWKAELKGLVAEAQERAENAALDALPDDGGGAASSGARTNAMDEFSMRGAGFVLRSPSRAKGKQKAEDVERVIMHCDFDCFFVSAGLVNRPQLRGKPTVVCHSQGSQGGASSTSEIASASYEARAFGIKNGMSLRQARQLCPEVVTIPYEFERYKSFSLQFYTILMRHADDLQAVSVDEALIDVSSAVARLRSASPLSADDFAVTLAQTIRAQVKQATECEVSIGIAENIQLARLATRRAKPAGLFHLKHEDVQKVLEPLDIDDLHGFGRSTRQKAREKIGATNLGELMTRSKAQLCEALGKGTGETLYKAVRGIDDRKLESDKPRKSVSCDINYGIRFENNEQAKEFVYRMAEEVARRLDSISMRGRLLSLKILKRDPSAPKEAPKFMGHGLCESFNKQTALANAHGQATSNSNDIGDHAWRLLKSWSFDPAELRGIGIHIQKLEDSRTGDVGQAKLPFQATDRKPVSKGPAPPRPELDDTPELVIQPPSSQGEPITVDAPVQKYDHQVGLPSLSQLDMEVLEALPEEIRKELEDEYLRRSHSPMAVEAIPAPIAPPSKGAVKGPNVKRITQQLAPKSRSSLSPKKSVLFTKRDTPASASAVRISDAELRELDIDPDVFAALPVDMQREQLSMARHTKKGGVFSERRLVIKDSTRAAREKKVVYPTKPPPKAYRPRPPTLKQQGKQKGEKLAFTETDDVQCVIEAWVEGFEKHPPNQKDVEFFCKFLVQSVEFSDAGMEKTIAVMRWWLVLLRRRWGVHERDQSEGGQATQRATSEVVGKAWWKAFREVKDKVDVAARKRFGGTLVLT
ncbi:DNA repair protein [Imleria badia]|nr:DNA repair protein [Imleria badia]